MAPLEIGYWKIRGLGAPLRMLCEYVGVEYKNSQYASGDEWFGAHKDRVLALNPLANLPYVIDGDVCVCQSNACMVYLGEKFGLYGGIQDLELLNEIYDLRNAVIDLVYPFRKVNRDQAEFDKSVEAHCQKIAPKFYAKLEALLTKTGTIYMLKDTPSVCDFHIFEMIDQSVLLATKFNHKSPITNFPKLQRLHQSFKDLPQLAAYFASEDYKLPCNNPFAKAYFA